MNLQNFNTAIRVLETVVMPNIIEHYGIQYQTAKDAPNTYKALRNSRDNLGYFLVYSGDSDNTIYTHERFNHMFRAWHDYIHYEYGFNFKPENEVRTALVQCDQARTMMETLRIDSEVIGHVIQILKADIIGQVHYYTKTGQYVSNQYHFVTGLLGIKVA